jgi:hypothetical protein
MNKKFSFFYCLRQYDKKQILCFENILDLFFSGKVIFLNVRNQYLTTMFWLV